MTSNRVVLDWGKYLGENTVATIIVDRLMRRAHVLEFEGKSYRLEDASARLTTLTVLGDGPAWSTQRVDETFNRDCPVWGNLIGRKGELNLANVGDRHDLGDWLFPSSAPITNFRYRNLTVQHRLVRTTPSTAELRIGITGAYSSPTCSPPAKRTFWHE